MSVEEFAKESKVSILTIYRILRGENLNIDTAALIYYATNGLVDFLDMLPTRAKLEKRPRTKRLPTGQESEDTH